MYMEEFTSLGTNATLDEIRRVVGPGLTYVSFDIDSLDPAFAPGTGTPEIGGLTPIQAQALIRGLTGLNLIGGDVVEVSPPFDPTGNTALVGATILYEMVCVLSTIVGQD
jgi:guanidinopropionase